MSETKMREFVRCDISGQWKEGGLRFEILENIMAEQVEDSKFYLRENTEGSLIIPYLLNDTIIIVENTPKGFAKGIKLYIDAWEVRLTEERDAVERKIRANDETEKRLKALRRFYGE